MTADRKLMAVEVRATSATFEAGVPRALFETRVVSFTQDRNQYLVDPDGQRFLVCTLSEAATSGPITLVLNWTAGLRR